MDEEISHHVFQLGVKILFLLKVYERTGVRFTH